MDSITLNFVEQGKEVTVPKGTIVSELLDNCDSKLRKKVLACRLNGRLLDVRDALLEPGNIEWVTFLNGGKDLYWHSSAHILAQAVKSVFPDVKLGIGPSISSGFYYDFEVEEPFTPDDLEKIENEIKQITRKNAPFEKKILTRDEALELFTKSDEKYKVELIKDIPDDDDVSIFTQDGFTDLCRGPHVPSTGKVHFFKLLSVAGAYWKGDEKNKMLQRIYGISFPDKKELAAYLKFLKEAEKRDHRKLGKELELFSTSPEAGSGFILYHPKGALLKHIIEKFETSEHLKRGYQLVMGPQILKQEMWKKSGHYDNYRENMYFTKIDEQVYGIKPMNCLNHMLVYKSKLRSYRDLPVRYFELGKVHRHEKSGVLHGLLRVREFTQDDAHILCSPEQLHQEIIGVIEFINDIMGIFGFEYEVEVSTRPEKSIGNDDDWNFATSALKSALDSKGMSYQINEGDGAFYGPKIDIKLKDVLGRYWQCATIQCDLALPERFDLTYVDKAGNKVRPVMIHRVILGSVERFIGVLIEHFGGAFPLWIAPEQVRVLVINDEFVGYAEEITKTLLDSDIRAETDFRNEKIGFKIRLSQTQKIPYTLILGQREKDEKNVTFRRYGETKSFTVSLESFISKLKEEIKSKAFYNKKDGGENL